MKRPPRPVSMILNLAPMVDVMMCLIIFFLLASKIVVAERQPLSLPTAEAAIKFDHEGLRSRVVVNVRPASAEAQPAGSADSPEAVADAVEYIVIDWDGKNIVQRSLTPPEIEPVLRTRAIIARTEKEELACVIRADRSVHYAAVELVMQAAARSGISKLVFSADVAAEQVTSP